MEQSQLNTNSLFSPNPFPNPVIQIRLVLLFSMLTITMLRLVNIDIGFTQLMAYSDANAGTYGGFPESYSEFIENRILNLEAAKSRRAWLLVWVFIGGAMLIVVNLFLNVRKARRVARSETELRLSHYENKSQDRIISKTKIFEESISEVENRLDDMESKLQSKIHDLNSLNEIRELDYMCNQEIKSINKESQKLFRKLKGEFKNFVKERLKTKGKLIKTICFLFLLLLFFGNISILMSISGGMVGIPLTEPEEPPPASVLMRGEWFTGTTGTTDTGDIEFKTEEYSDIEKRLAVLESAKQDTEVWVDILLAMVTLLIALNIGLSIWQVGSIARREVENGIKEYDEKFNRFLTDKGEDINKKLADYDSRLETIKEKTSELNLNVEKNIDLIDERINAFRKDADNILDKFRTESQNVKLSVLNELQTYHSKQMQILMEKEKKQDNESA